MEISLPPIPKEKLTELEYLNSTGLKIKFNNVTNELKLVSNNVKEQFRVFQTTLKPNFFSQAFSNAYEEVKNKANNQTDLENLHLLQKISVIQLDSQDSITTWECGIVFAAIVGAVSCYLFMQYY